MPQRPCRIALIGCGAIADALYLPAFTRRASGMQLVCVDASEARARAAALRLPGWRWHTDYREILDEVDGAIVAVPPSLHHAVALRCLERGTHVLCEKPLALSFADAQELVSAAGRSGAALAVNNGRRLFPSLRETQRLLADGAIGTVRRLDLELGEAFDWPAASASYFGVAAGGKGVLLDIGAHILDLACWWLGGKPTVTNYADDSLGGTEAFAVLEFALGACAGRITLSWLSRLRNGFTVAGDAGTISGQMYDWRSFSVTRNGRARRVQVRGAPRTLARVGEAVVDNFIEVLEGRSAPLVSGRDVLPSIELIEECYARRRRLSMPWHDAMDRILQDTAQR